jgi:myo-inositol 2-dehydrogenase / D-chiro-inositol 1-dehydrogenase
VRIGLIGAGRIGAIHSKALAELDEVDTQLIFDVAPQRAIDLADDVGGEAVESLETLFQGADAVLIASTADTHAPMLIRAAEAGLPAFCEKPIAIDLDSSQEAVDAVRKAGILAQVGFQRRFEAGYRSVRDHVAAGRLGRLYVIHHVSHDHDIPPADYVPNSGGLFRDNLIHDFDVTRFITGDEVAEVYAAGQVLVADYFGDHGDVDTGAVILRFGQGTLGVMHAVRHDPVGYDVRIQAFGSKDSVSAGWNERTPIRSLDPDATPPEHPYRTWTERFGDAYRDELAEFVHMVRTGERGIAASPDDAHEALRIGVACIRSRAENRPVRLEEVA